MQKIKDLLKKNKREVKKEVARRIEEAVSPSMHEQVRTILQNNYQTFIKQ
jgi:hypothetical protein